MKLILSGGGNEIQSRVSHQYLISELGHENKLLYIPIAMDQAEISWSDCYNWLEAALGEFSFTNIDMVTELNGFNEKSINNYKAIYIGGGNTYSLLREFQNSNFNRLIKHFAQENLIIYGGSAGAIILGESIATCAHLDKNEVGLTDLKALNLINNYSVLPHFNHLTDINLGLEYCKKLGKIIAIPEDAAVVYDTTLKLLPENLSLIGTGIYEFANGNANLLQ